MPQNKVQQRARMKREQQKQTRKQQERNRKIRAAVTTVAVLGLALTAFIVMRNNDDKTATTGDGSKPTTSATGAGGATACGGKARGAYKPKKYSAPPKMAIDTKKTYTATIETSCGTIQATLLDDSAPKTVNNFVVLARDKFFDQSIFHRVIKGFMAQGGDPLGTGSGDPGYKFEDETSPQDSFSKPGLLAMANSGPNTNGSQFFITEVPTPHLNGKHTIFGEVTKGLDVVQKIADVQKNGEEPSPPVVIYKVTITEA